MNGQFEINADRNDKLVTFELPNRKEQLCQEPECDSQFYVQDLVKVSNISQE